MEVSARPGIRTRPPPRSRPVRADRRPGLRTPVGPDRRTPRRPSFRRAPPPVRVLRRPARCRPTRTRGPLRPAEPTLVEESKPRRARQWIDRARPTTALLPAANAPACWTRRPPRFRAATRPHPSRVDRPARAGQLWPQELGLLAKALPPDSRVGPLPRPAPPPLHRARPQKPTPLSAVLPPVRSEPMPRDRTLPPQAEPLGPELPEPTPLDAEQPPLAEPSRHSRGLLARVRVLLPAARMPPRSKVSPAAGRASATPPPLSRPPRLRQAASGVRARSAPPKPRAPAPRPPHSRAGPPASRAIARLVQRTQPPQALSPERARSRTVLPPPVSRAAPAARAEQSIDRARLPPSAELPRSSRVRPGSRADRRRSKADRRRSRARRPRSRAGPPDSRVRAQAAWGRRLLLPLLARLRSRRVPARWAARPLRKALVLSRRRSPVEVRLPRKVGLSRE
ncbi:hypothetical protein FB390_1586 [Nocardia bhagyanarayanae]|uniref:Uncharacterized protein n=1 Tax=Nocardia bhagyanarayanae TaxID=1215925 RepID=A0A543F811_9NOCA|nr:hypothetical protein FB390_1586 [Nocardia bhagyanarayanae]